MTNENPGESFRPGVIIQHDLLQSKIITNPKHNIPNGVEAEEDKQDS